MLRAPLLRSRGIATGALKARTTSQWHPVQRRYLADGKRADETLIPGTGSSKAPNDIPPPPILQTSPVSPSNVPLENIPKSPPSPETTGSIASVPPKTSSPTPVPPTGTGTATVAPPAGNEPTPPSPIPKKKSRRFRTFLLTLLILSGLGYAGGVYYSLISDNFHDFFTEYIPYGEDAVAYFEDREFRKRFPSKPVTTKHHEQVKGENKVTIPSHSGLAPRVATSDRKTDLGAAAPHLSAVEEGKQKADTAAGDPKIAEPSKKITAVEQAKESAKPEEKSSSHELLPKSSLPQTETPKVEEKKVEEAKPAPPPAPLIDNLEIPQAEEPVVQDIVKVLNNIITVINADNASGKYSLTISQAKESLSKILTDVSALKSAAQKEAEDKIHNSHMEFDNAAKELVRRLEVEMKDQENHWREEYESEREKLAKSYQEKVAAEIEAANKIYEQKLKNQLLEQSIQLQRNFTDSIRDRVETERSGRLSKLSELQSEVEELERLTGEWNRIVDANLKTQYIHVAVEGVKSALEHADRPTPFIKELVALKEIASDDPVINAAIASIHPSAYQRGIPTTAQLIDRFRRVATEVRKASLLPEDAGVASHAASLLLSKVMFKKKGLPVGDDVESVLTRTEVLLEEGNLDDAAREMNSLTGWARTLSRDWVAECRKVLEVKQALDVIATEARLQSLLVD
ncbi:hypothetical protein M501DRAFT_931535 [Patellaria atrata CBS 101060]|uniref:MICOS complex subunit MIC60 n=1 Tax=Patellaria atrata CBS 101060 TaxID=1346257 RepID=A0A9P4VT24_9PEZI|nr:hypothetical protein M501DRAFT_931535 [Patellaria atrata CBS 101060]